MAEFFNKKKSQDQKQSTAPFSYPCIESTYSKFLTWRLQPILLMPISYMQKLLNKEDRMLKNLLNDSNVSSSPYASELCHIGSITTENFI